MSLLSSTQGTPERVWSLISLLAASGGRLERATAADCLNPGFTENTIQVAEKPSAFSQTLGAATSLGVVEAVHTDLQLDPACPTDSYAAFCDWVHARLISLDSTEKDAVVLETFAWVAVETDRQGSCNWLHDATNDAFADAADKALPPGDDDDGDRRINTVKLAAWRRWLLSLGLAVPLTIVGAAAHPLVDSRVARVVRSLEGQAGQDLSADAFLALLAPRLPYLDGGRMFLEAARRVGHALAPRRLSPILSATLRNLHDDGLIEMQLQGDAGNLMHLHQDRTHKVASFNSVVLTGAA